jgi:hypothetical protein
MPLFEDLEENKHRADPYTNAYTFAVSIFNSISKDPKFVIKAPQKFEIVENKEEEIFTEDDDYKQTKLPEFRGVAQEMFKLIYNSSVIPRSRFSVASTLGVMGTILANRVACRTSTEAIYTNMFLLILGDSGSGKNVPINFPGRFFREAGCKDLICSPPESDAGICDALYDGCSWITCYDEASSLFGSMSDTKNQYSYKMGLVYSKLFTAGGNDYDGRLLKGKKLGECRSPCISILGAMTIHDFRKTFKSDLVKQGIGARFLFFPDKEIKKPNFRLKRPEIDKDLLKFTKDFRSWINTDYLKFDGQKPHILETSDSMITKFENISDEFAKRSIGKNPIIKPIYDRLFQNMIKIAIIDSISNYQARELKHDNLDFAKNWMDSYLDGFESFFEENFAESKQNEMLRLITLHVKKKKEKGITHRDLMRISEVTNTLPLSKDIMPYIQSLEAIGEIVVQKKGKSTIFYHDSFVKKI